MFVKVGENQMNKHLKLSLLLIIIFTPAIFSKVDATAHTPFSTIYPIALIPETQNDANSGGDAGDNFDNATVIATGTFYGSLPSDDNDDFYRVYINQNRHATITLSGDNETDFDLHLYAPDRNIIQSSQNNDSNEFIEIDILNYGYWFVRIEKYNLTSHGNYSLFILTSAITSTNPTLMQNDANSGGDAGNTFFTATTIRRGRSYGMLVDFDFYDYYKIDLITGDIISVHMSFSVSVNFDLFLYNPGFSRIALSTLGEASESFVTTVSLTGSFKILVSRLVGFGPYEINIKISHPSELEFNWKALVAFVAVLAVIIGVFIITRYVRRRPPTKIQRIQVIDKSESVEQKDLSSTEHEVLSFEDALVESGKDLSEEEREVLNKILKGYSTRKEKEKN